MKKNMLASAISNTRAKAEHIALVAALALSPGLAFASGGGDFDGTEIIAKVVTYTAVGVLILGAFALGRWTLRAMGLIGGK